MIIYSHRGIDLDRSESLAENSLEAFSWAAESGFGVELDVQLNSQGEIIVAHDSTATHWSHGRCHQKWPDISIAQLRNLESECGKIPLLRDALQLAKEKSMHVAVHLKGSNQNAHMLNALTTLLAQWKSTFAQMLVFDCKTETAKALKDKFPDLPIAVSVATEEDIFHFNSLTNHTLYSLEVALRSRAHFGWAWLDEWRSTLYDKSTFDLLRQSGMRSVVISPELHKSENHPDAQNLGTLEARWMKILALKPDAICTDYPTRIAALTQRPA